MRVTDVGFQDVSLDDLDALRAMASRIWWSCYRGMIPDAQIEQMLGWMYAPEQVASELEKGVRWEWLEVSGERRGYLSWEPGGPGLLLHKLYLEPAFHGRGLGQRMLEHMERQAIRHGADWIELRVNRANDRALRAYRRAGYERVADDARPIGGGFLMDDHILRRAVARYEPSKEDGGEGGIRTPGSV